MDRARQSGNGTTATILRALVHPWHLQRQDDDPDAGSGDQQPGSGTVTIPEVTIVGNPNDAGNDGQNPALADQQPGSGQATIPEVTIVGDPNQADAGAPDGGGNAPPSAAPLVAAGLGEIPGLPGPGGPGPGPGGPLELPPIPETPLNPGFGASGSFVEPAAAAGTGETAAVAGGVGLGTAIAVGAAGFAVGFAGPALVGLAVEHAEDVNQQPDPDVLSPPGGAPPPTSESGDGGAPLQLPAGQTPAPAIDPNTGQPISAPADQNPVPATDPSAPGAAQLPGQPDAGPAQATAIVQGPPPPGTAAIADKIPGAVPGQPVQIGKVTKQTVLIDGQTYIGGDPFRNDGNPLPAQTPDGKPITYTEYDAIPYQPGVNRKSERFVVGSDGHIYYTNDHYSTFFVVK